MDLRREFNFMNKLKERWNVTSNWQLVIIFIVFAITGSTAAYLSKPVTSALGIYHFGCIGLLDY